MKIAIITDGNNKLGMGHVYQSLTLAALLAKQNYHVNEIVFITKSSDNVIELLEKSTYKVYSYNDDKSIFDYLSAAKPDRIIFDKLDVSVTLARKIREQLKIKQIIFTNLTSANKYADVTVMAGMGSAFKNIRSKNELTGQVQFWGPKYWLLRPEFYTYAKKEVTTVNSIMLMFGGADPSNLSTLVSNELLQMDTAFKITLVLGAAFAHHSELDYVISKNKASRSTIQVVKSLVAVADAMYHNDVIFVSPGLSFFEAILVNTPVVCFHQNKFQQDAWKGHVTTFDKDEVIKVPALIENRNFIFPDDAHIAKMEIGKGATEIVSEILN